MILLNHPKNAPVFINKVKFAPVFLELRLFFDLISLRFILL